MQFAVFVGDVAHADFVELLHGLDALGGFGVSEGFYDISEKIRDVLVNADGFLQTQISFDAPYREGKGIECH